MSGIRVLLVDDDTAVLVMLKTVLELHGYDVTTAVSAAEGVARLAADEFDLVLTDMKMETNLAGLQVVRAAAAKPETPVVMILTAFPLPVQLCREAGAHEVFNKPIGVACLLESLDRMLSARRARKSA